LSMENAMILGPAQGLTGAVHQGIATAVP
jgi:hypothetical protein